ncbi:MAG: 2-oxoglutarate dehydrogenase complex dihydrolipoyllysine-residue succinyltransferase [Bacteroidota bacterium]
MILEIKIPSPGESISEVQIASWFVKDGDYVSKNQEIGEVESEKATLPLIAGQSGRISILKEGGGTAAVGEVVCTIDTSVAAPATETKKEAVPEAKDKKPDPAKQEKVVETVVKSDEPMQVTTGPEAKATPLAKRMMEENGIRIEEVIQGLRKLSAADVKAVIDSRGQADPAAFTAVENSRESVRNKMSPLRKKLSDRLVAVKNQTAMLTTFNEADMSAIMKLRNQYQAAFTTKHGIKLGFMSFFAMAAAAALKEFPAVNSYLEGDEIVSPEYVDIGIAVQTEKGLMVPVVRNAESLGLAGLEKAIAALAEKARKNRISIEEMSGGTFTITNGGVFGSMLSTPILNPPQSAILGMHNIIERPVAVSGKVEIRPMMYLALSYDHRIIDGRDSVGFLKRIKEYIEEPVNLLYQGKNPEKTLLEVE